MKDFYNNSISENCHLAISEKISRFNEEGSEEAFFIADIQEIFQKHRSWLMHLPRIQPVYGIRCNEDPEVLQLLSQLEIGFECTSKAEIKTVIKKGIPAKKVIYNNPCKQISHLKYAQSNDIEVLSFDSEFELDKIKNFCPDAKLLLCLSVEDQSCKALKFGCNLDNTCLLLEHASNLDLNVVGVNVRIGTNKDLDAYTTAIEVAHQAFVIADSLGFNFQCLHISDGFYGNFGSLDELNSTIGPLLDEYFPEAEGVKIMADCSRWYLTSAYYLVANVIAKRKVKDSNSKQSFMYYLNDGVYGSFSFLLYEKNASVTPIVMQKGNSHHKYVCSLWGPTCDGLDCILQKTVLPELNIGDWILFPNMGAYASSSASDFNGMPKPGVFYMNIETSKIKSCRNEQLFSRIHLDTLQLTVSPTSL